MGKTKFYALKYADDIATVAKIGQELGEMLKSLERYVERAISEVNVQITKIMIFRGGGGRRRGRCENFREKKLKWS